MIKQKNWLLLCISLLFSNLIAAQTKNEFVTIIIEDTSLLTSKTILNFIYIDSIRMGHNIILNKKENKLLIPYPTFIICSDENQTPYWIKPGETIYLKKDTGTQLNLSIPGNTQRTNELGLFPYLIARTGPVYSPIDFSAGFLAKQKYTKSETDSFAHVIDAYTNTRQTLLHLYTQEHEVNASFKQTIRSMISSAGIHEHLYLCSLNRQVFDSITYRQHIQQYTDSLKAMPFTADYIYHGTLINSAGQTFNGKMGDVAVDTTELAKRFAFTRDNYSGIQRDFLLTHLTLMAHIYRITLPPGYMKEYNTLCRTERFKKLLAAYTINQQSLNLTKGSNQLQRFDGTTVTNLQQVIAAHKGKVLLLDFWASWCSPCRNELPSSAQLRQYFSGKNVAFAYLSIDQKAQDWINASKEESLPPAGNFRFADPTGASFITQNKINTIPRYILIAKDGKTIDADAPRPTDPRLKELISKNL